MDVLEGVKIPNILDTTLTLFLNSKIVRLMRRNGYRPMNRSIVKLFTCRARLSISKTTQPSNQKRLQNGINSINVTFFKWQIIKILPWTIPDLQSWKKDRLAGAVEQRVGSCGVGRRTESIEPFFQASYLFIITQASQSVCVKGPEYRTKAHTKKPGRKILKTDNNKMKSARNSGWLPLFFSKITETPPFQSRWGRLLWLN